ncbi:hypothetical protein [Acidovorax sp. ACV01]|uniref:hypothetical protein n=1 Tax=Acidovorax sp. ACV01 TaxID=2769311 RepID=UPI00177EB26D|nr:hypothetical protein [Acidovorax sp. ACV01]MBD9395601.1 hypothetical protein [Acidovorax sp. ACV01]
MSTAPAVTPLELAQRRLANYLEAETRILQSQEYTVGQGGTARRTRRAELEQVQNGIREVRIEIATLTAAATRRGRVSYLRPRC